MTKRLWEYKFINMLLKTEFKILIHFGNGKSRIQMMVLSHGCPKFI